MIHVVLYVQAFSVSPLCLSPPSPRLSSLLVLCRPAAERGCVTSQKAGAAPCWLERIKKWGDDCEVSVRRTFLSFFENPTLPIALASLCVRLRVSLCERRCNTFMHRRECSPAMRSQFCWWKKKNRRKNVSMPACHPVLRGGHSCCHQHRGELTCVGALGSFVRRVLL